MNFGVCDFSRLAVTDLRLRWWRLWFLALVTPTRFDIMEFHYENCVWKIAYGKIKLGYLSIIRLFYERIGLGKVVPGTKGTRRGD